MQDLVYLDHNSTTPCDPRVVEAMLPFFTAYFGNASSSHQWGNHAANAVDIARGQVAELIGARTGEIVWTSGATESNHLAILGTARAYRSGNRPRIVTSAIEHKAVAAPCQVLSKEGFEVITLPVSREGQVDINAAHQAINEETLLVSIQLANGEIGTIQPIVALAALAHERGAFFHCDAAQAVGKVGVDVNELGIDFMSLSAHKMYGPKGIGALYVRSPRRANLEPISYGGGQERGWRSGTLNVPAIVGFGVAANILQDEMADLVHRQTSLRDGLEELIENLIDGVTFNGNRRNNENRLPQSSSVTVSGVEADALLARCSQVALSTGSACDSGSITTSPTLRAIGLSEHEARATFRFCVGRDTSHDEIELAAQMLAASAEAIRSLSVV